MLYSIHADHIVKCAIFCFKFPSLSPELQIPNITPLAFLLHRFPVPQFYEQYLPVALRLYNERLKNKCELWINTAITYKELSTISGTGAAIWSETNFGPTTHHHLRSSPLPRICAVPSASNLAMSHREHFQYCDAHKGAWLCKIWSCHSVQT
jgi:hypothetical protein